MKPSLIAALVAPLAFAACASDTRPAPTPVAPVVQAPPPAPAPGPVARAACETAATPMVRRM
ncbi:MAG: VWA domain-containing protein, partial [Pseudomonadota bacterium]